MKKIFLLVLLIFLSACSITGGSGSLANFSNEVLFKKFDDSKIITFDYEKTIYYYNELYGDNAENKLLKTLKDESATKEILIERLKKLGGSKGTANNFKSLIYTEFLSIASAPSGTSNLLYQLVALASANYVKMDFGENVFAFVKIDENDLRVFVLRDGTIVDPIYKVIKKTLNTVKNIDFYHTFIDIIGSSDFSALSDLSKEEQTLMEDIVSVYIAEYFRFKNTPVNTYQRDNVSGVLLNVYLANGSSKKGILKYLSTNGWSVKSADRKKLEEQITTYVKEKQQSLYDDISKMVGSNPNNLFYAIAEYLEKPKPGSLSVLHEFIEMLANNALDIEKFIAPLNA